MSIHTLCPFLKQFLCWPIWVLHISWILILYGIHICKDRPFSIQPFCFSESFLHCAKLFIIVWCNPTCLSLLLFPLPEETYPKNIMLIKVNIKEHQFNGSVMANSLPPHELQHVRPPCPSSTPRVYPNSCPLNWWCHPTISSSVIPFSSCRQSFPASGSFPMIQLSESGSQSVGAWASASVLPMNIQGWFPLGLTGLISLLSKRLSKVFSSTTVQKHQFFCAQPFLWFNSHIHTWLLEKP